MSIEFKEIAMKVDALVGAMDAVIQKLSWGDSDVQYNILHPFRRALDDVERMKFAYMTSDSPELVATAPDFSDTIRLKEIENFLRKRGRTILHAQDDHGLKIRPQENNINRYVIYLGKFDQDRPPMSVRFLQNPRLRLEFNFDYYRPEGEWQLIENIRLIAEGGPTGAVGVVANVIPEGLIRRDTWKRILRHALNAIDSHEVMDELEAFFPPEAPADLA